MGRFELLILALAVITFSVFSVIAIENQVDSRLNIIKNEIELSAYAQAEAILQRAHTLDFDPYTRTHDDANLSDTANFSAPGDLNSSKDLPDIIDLNGFGSSSSEFKTFNEKDIKINGDKFYSYVPKTKVDYVNGEGKIVNHRTSHKKVTVLLEITSMDMYTRNEFEENLESGSNRIPIEWNIKKQSTFNFGTENN